MQAASNKLLRKILQRSTQFHRQHTVEIEKVDFQNSAKIYYFLCEAQEKGLSNSSIGDVCLWQWKKLAAYKKLYNSQKKHGLMKNCAKVRSHGYGIYENVIVKVVAIRKKNMNG